MVALVLFECRKESYRLCFVWRVFLCEVRCRGTVCFEVVGAGVWAWTACESGSCFDLYSRKQHLLHFLEELHTISLSSYLIYLFRL